MKAISVASYAIVIAVVVLLAAGIFRALEATLGRAFAAGGVVRAFVALACLLVAFFVALAGFIGLFLVTGAFAYWARRRRARGIKTLPEPDGLRRFYRRTPAHRQASVKPYVKLVLKNGRDRQLPGWVNARVL